MVTWRSRLLGALLYGLLGSIVGLAAGLVAGLLLACRLHMGGNLCGMVAVFSFPLVGSALVGASGIALGIWREYPKSRKPNST